MALFELQAAMDASLASASPLTRSLFARSRLRASGVQRLVNAVMSATVATVKSDGAPHAVLVLAACLDGTVIFTASPNTVLLGNLRRSPAVAITVASPDHDVVINGTAEVLGRARDLPALLDRLRRLSPKGRFTPEDWPGYLCSVKVDKIFVN